MTLEATGVLSRLRAGGYDLIDRDAARTPEERMDLMRRALTCGTYFASVNAMTEDGEMVNIDGNGNRVAAIAFGPKRVVLVVGMNKVCGDLSAAVTRARRFVAPANGLRLGLEHLPCVKTGVCCDCRTPESMCAQIVRMRCSRVPGRIKIVLVGEDCGL